MDAIAERAGVSKATIYRWWPTKEALALDALYYEWAAASDPGRDTGSLKGDLLALLRPLGPPRRQQTVRARDRGADRGGENGSEVRRGVP